VSGTAGMAEQMGWMVTIQTELAFRDFVLGKTRNLKQGCVRFAPCGGDTTQRIERPEAPQTPLLFARDSTPTPPR
jgi:hypothetical protein